MPYVADQLVFSPAEIKLLRRAKFLPERDAALVRSALERRLPIKQVAKIVGVHPGTLTRRVQRLLRRLSDPTAGLLMEHGQFLPPELRQIGIERLVQGLTLRQIAEHHHLSIYQVRAALTELKGCIRARAMRGGE